MASSNNDALRETNSPSALPLPSNPPSTFIEKESTATGTNFKLSPSHQTSGSMAPPSYLPVIPGEGVSHGDVEKAAGGKHNPSLPIIPPAKGLSQQRVQKAKGDTNKHNMNTLAWSTFWVLLGICFMLAGTIIVHRFLLPKVYSCPDGATCRHNFDPRGRIISRLQTLMQYWLQAGIIIAGVGLSKLIAYDSRLVLMKKGSTIRAVERSIRAAGGSWQDAALQVTLVQVLMHPFRRVLRRATHHRDDTQPNIQHGTSWLGILALAQIAICLSLSLVVGFSIPNLQGTKIVDVPFSYHSSFTLPRADNRYFSTDERIVGGVLNDWLVMPNRPHRPFTAFDGSLVLQDNRTVSAVNSQPSGSHIRGSVSCSRQGWNASIMPLDSPYLADGHATLPPGGKAYNISNEDVWLVTYSYVPLAATFFAGPEISNSLTNRQYLWAGNTSSVIPNATASFDGGIFFAACNHTIHMDNLPPVVGSGVQAINPSQPMIYTDVNDPYLDPCPSNDPLACVSWSVDDIIASWWVLNLVQHDLVPFSCLGGVLAGFDGLSDTPDCTLNGDRWTKTVSTALSALIFSAPVSGSATQTLSVPTEAINTDRWWIQAILPGVIFLLYLACMVYTWHLSSGVTTDLQELDLPAILCDRDEQLRLDPVDIHNTKVTIL